MKFQAQQIRKILEFYPTVFPIFGVDPENKYCLCSKKETCEHSGKHPMGSIKKIAPLRTLEEIQDFTNSNSGCNFALLLDNCIDLVVIDIDKRNGGLESFEKIQNDFGVLPTTATTLTGGDGLHLYFKIPNKSNFQSKLNSYPGIDIKHNGLIMLPGSNHKSGKQYVWKDGLSPELIEIANLPQNYFELFKKPQVKINLSNNDASITQGSRNSELFKFALGLVTKGCTPEQLLCDVAKINETKCSPPLSNAEVEQIINSALTYKKPDIQNYLSIGGKLCYSKSGEIEDAFPLCNFDARFVSEAKIYDSAGKVISNTYKIEILNPTLANPLVDVTPEELDAGSWVNRVDSRLMINIGKNNSQHVARAIKLLGNLEAKEDNHTTLGYIQTAAGLTYLSGNGSVTKDGFNDQYYCDSSAGVHGFSIGFTDSFEKLNLIFESIQKFLKLKNKVITLPMLASVFRAPLIHNKPVDFVIWIVGQSGCHKSTMAGLIMSYFGKAFDYANLPDSFNSTLNSIGKKAHITNCHLNVVDDHVPGEQTNRFVETLVRNAGNRQGRGRLNADSTIKQTPHPRCLLAITAEDLQAKQSIVARSIVIPLYDGQIDKDILTELQTQARNGLFSDFLGAYIHWIINNNDKIKSEIESIFDRYRKIFSQSKNKHPKTENNLANLFIGLHYLSAFCEEKKILSQESSRKFLENAKITFLDLFEHQNKYLQEEDLTESFFSLIQAVIKDNKAYIVDHDSDTEAELCGSPHENKKNVGYILNRELVIDKNITWDLIKEYGRRFQREINISKDGITKRLTAKNYLINDDSGHLTPKRMMGDKRRRRSWVFSNSERVLDPDYESITEKAPQAPLFKTTDADKASLKLETHEPENKTMH